MVFTNVEAAAMVRFCPLGAMVIFEPGTRTTLLFRPFRLVTRLGKLMLGTTPVKVAVPKFTEDVALESESRLSLVCTTKPAVVSEELPSCTTPFALVEATGRLMMGTTPVVTLPAFRLVRPEPLPVTTPLVPTENPVQTGGMPSWENCSFKLPCKGAPDIGSRSRNTFSL